MGRSTWGAFEGKPTGQPPLRRHKEVAMFTGFTWPGHRVTRARSRSRRDSQQPQSTQHRRLLRSSALTLLALGCLLMLPGSSSASEEEAPILFDSDASSALVVEVEQRCSEERLRTIDAEVLWGFDATAKTKAVGLKELRESTEVSIDLTVYPRGFERGDFERIVVPTEALQTQKRAQLRTGNTSTSSPAHSYLLTNLSPGVMYSARLLVRTHRGWVPSGIVRFRTPICAVDMADEDAGGER